MMLSDLKIWILIARASNLSYLKEEATVEKNSTKELFLELVLKFFGHRCFPSNFFKFSV